MPTTSPRTFNSGPPELPGLIAASVCSIGCSRPRTPPSGRPSAEITPTVTVWLKLNGLPMATTQSPGCICAESPNFASCSVATDDLRRVALRAAAAEQADADVVGVFDDMIVGEDETGLVDDEAGAGAF